jgi:hypothetical protein
LWTCGTQRCWGKASKGRLTFGGGGAVADYEDEWPLDPGTYVAVFGRAASVATVTGLGSTGYDISSYSNIFRVKTANGFCGSPQPTSHPPSTASDPGPTILISTRAPLEAYPTTTHSTTTRPTMGTTPNDSASTHSKTPGYPTTETTASTSVARGTHPPYHPNGLSPTNYAKRSLTPTNYAQTSSSSASPRSNYTARAPTQPTARLPTSTPQSKISPIYHSTEPPVVIAKATNASTTVPPKAPTSLAQVIEAAKKELKTLMMALPSLSAIFLRLIFYDCKCTSLAKWQTKEPLPQHCMRTLVT